MTYEELVSWAEEEIGDFKKYDSLEDFEKDLTEAPGKKAGPGDGRAEGAQEQLKRWFNEEIDVDGYDAGEIKGAIIDNATEDVREKVTEAETEEDLDKIDMSGLKGEARETAEGLVEGRRGEIIVEDREGALKEIRDKIDSAEKYDDMPDITMGEIRRLYGEDARMEISGLIADKNAELIESEEREFRGDIVPRIKSATIDDLSSLRSEIRAGLPSGVRSFPLEEELLEQISGRQDELRS